MSESGRSTLEDAARLWGVLSEYRSQMGDLVRSSDEAVIATLGVLGAPVRSVEDAAEAGRAARTLQWSTMVEPVAVCWIESGAPSIGLRLLPAEAEGSIACELTLEDGTTREWSVRGDALRGIRAETVDGHDWVSASMALPPDLPRGMHRLELRAGARTGRALVLRAPTRAWTPEVEGGAPRRDWGLFMPAYALRTARTPGVADVTDLAAAQRWTRGRGGAFFGTLPLLAAFLDEPFDQSPYAPVSRLFWNELYLDPERTPGIEEAVATRALLRSEAYRREGERLRAAPRVEYRAAMAHRRAVLERAAREFAPADAPLPAALAEFAATKPQARAYARFRAVADRERRSWRDWPAHTRAGSVGERDFAVEPYRYHLYVQWAMDTQLIAQGRGGDELAALYMDLPLGTHRDGFDTWCWRDLFSDASLGAPPDAFFTQGQDWGCPAPHPGRSRAEGHGYWIATLRHVMRAAAMLRLDHAMALHRAFWVPPGMSASNGVYVRYPAEELYAILSLESHRHRTELVGEDLGTVPPEVCEGMERHALRRMFVVPFEIDGESGALARPVHNRVASLGTHDMPPFRALLDEDGFSRKLAVALGEPSERDPRALSGAALERIATSPARLVLVSAEDLWQETEPQNRPGTPAEENWRQRARLTLEELDASEEARTVLDRVRRARRESAGPGTAFRAAESATFRGERAS